MPINSYPVLVFIVSGDLKEAELWLARASATAPDSGAVAALQLLLAAARNNRAEVSKLANDLPAVRVSLECNGFLPATRQFSAVTSRLPRTFFASSSTAQA